MKSIILLAMSILNPSMKLNEKGDSFSVASDPSIEIEDCRSQLEPVVRYFLSDEKCTDKVEILMLCTRPTLEEFIPQDESKYTNKEGIEFDKISAVSFLKKRIEECYEKGEKEITYKVFHLYRDDGEIPRGIDAEIVLDKKCSVPDYLSGIRSVIKEIRATVMDNNKENIETPFYIVSHGGLRDVILSLNAIISLMDGEGVSPTKICGTNTSNHTIEDQRASFDIFRFVSGMQDFLNVGSVDILQNYYKESVYLYISDKKDAEEFNKKLLNAMNKVSIGVQYSNPESYISGLDDLKKVLDTDIDDKFEKTSLGIFKDTIKKDFGVLLDPEKRTEVDMVERCVNKKQYQQALTFLESELPKYYREKGIISFYGNNHKNRREKFNKFLTDVIKLPNCKKSPVIIINSFIDKRREGKNWEEALIDNENWGDSLEKDIVEYLEKWTNSNKKENTYCLESIGNKYNFINDILPVLKMHKVLKVVRNGFSHSDGFERPEINDLDEYIKCYLTALKKLVEKAN